jgi:3' terminal RNA ribose 2'-O-methyltransferase Hen1
MLLTITTTHRPATDLGYLLVKHPGKVQSFALAHGTAHVFYPEASEERCTAALLLDVDPVGLVRGRREDGGAVFDYVNDRPYVASSFLSVAIARVFASAMGGRSKGRPQLAESAIPLTATIEVVACDAGEPLLRRLFEPLGYAVEARGHALDERFPEWGDSRYFSLALSTERRLKDLLLHLYVLLPVLDNDKHYWVGRDELEKLLAKREGWLAQHPERELVTRRYLKYRSALTREALARLAEEDDVDPDASAADHDHEEIAVEETVSLNAQRIGAVVAAVRESGARRVLDLGCGEGRLLKALLEERSLERIVGVDVSLRALEAAKRRLRLERLPPSKAQRLELLQGSLVYRDKRLAGFDAACVVEVIEHLDPPRLEAFARALFGDAKPRTVIVTTPNVEYNVRFPTLPAGRLRHRDHRFEWTRAEFEAWARGVAGRFGYAVRHLPIGPLDEAVGAPTQMAIFAR